MQRIAIIVAVVLFAGIRPLMPTTAISWPGTYQAFAHLFVGGLLGAFAVSLKNKSDATGLYFGAAVSLSIIEVICAVAKRAM